MRKLFSRRLVVLLFVGVLASFAVAGIALAGSKDKSPPPAGQLLLQLGNGTPEPGVLSVNSYSWGVVNPAGKGKTGAVSASDFNFNRSVDSSSSSLLTAATSGTVFAKVDFTATFHSGAATTTIAYELLNAQVTSEQQSGAINGGSASESFSIGGFSMVTWTITDSSGTTTGSFTP
jgi:type VI protein secretion system component Hcp